MNKEPWQWDINDVKRLVELKEKESAYLDYKASNALKNEDLSKNEISKDVSAFANAGGGTIIYGVNEENGNPVGIDEGINPDIIRKEWLDQVINSRIKRKIDGVKIHQIPIDKEKGDRVIFVVSIPKSLRAPHQAWDKKFYTRRNFQSEPMEEYEVRDVFMREKAPHIVLDLFFDRHGTRKHDFPLSLVNPETVHNLEINGALRNEGGGEVQYAVIILHIEQRLYKSFKNLNNVEFRPIKFIFNEKEIDAYRMVINWGGPSKMPLFKTVEYHLLPESINVQFMHSWLLEDESPFIMWEVRAPRMEPCRGFIRLKLKESSVILKPEEVPTDYTLLQDGRNREFLKTPNLSIKPDL